MGIDYPILQGPFGGGLSTPGLVASVSNLGGLGGYGAYSISPQEIYEVDKQIKALTDKPYNLNLWVSDTDVPDGGISDAQYERTKKRFKSYFDEVNAEFPQKPDFKTRFENQVQVILDVKPKVFSFVFGIPEQDVLEEMRKRGILLVGAATTLEEALALENAGVDAIIASGFESGGHRPSFLEPAELSLTGSFVLTQLIKEKINKIPIIAAGGIANANGIKAAFALGADAVQIGTAFLATEESGALPEHRAALLSGSPKQTMLTRAYTGRLGRGMGTALAKDITGKEEDLLPFPLQTAFMSALRKAALDQQKHEMVLFWSGQIAPILKHTKSESLMQELIKEMET
ncbi:Nitronate monooxygenase [compost metagenome]